MVNLTVARNCRFPVYVGTGAVVSLRVIRLNRGRDALLNGMLAVSRGEKTADVIKITYDVVDASIDVLHKIPAYVMRDFSGMIMEADFDLHSVHQDLRVGWKDVSGNLKGAKNGSVNLELLRTMLDKWGVGTLEIDAVREAFERIFSKAGEVGPRAWEKILQSYIRKKRRPGRPRNTNYDSLFERRISNPGIETYGKLLRQLADADTVPREVVRNRLKSAISYRRKRSQKI